MLYDDQREISNDIYTGLLRRELYNIPTGRGKTFILLDVARRAIEDGKPVIISVPNNNLVREMYAVAKSFFGFTDDNAAIRIGLDNYIDRDKLLALAGSGVLNEYIEEGGVEAYLENHKERRELFFDDFNIMVQYKERAFEGTVRRLICKDRSDEVDKAFKALTITNHFYILGKAIYDKNFEAGDYVFLMDEVHEISGVAESIMSDSFSIFEYKNVLSALSGAIEELGDSYGMLDMKKTIRTLIVRSHNLHEKHKNEGMIGNYVTGSEEVFALRNSVDRLLHSKEHAKVKKQLRRLVESGRFNSSTVRPDSLERFDEIVKHLPREKSTENDSSFGVYYSPSRGYPTLRASTKNPLGQLNIAFWKKVVEFGGVSASTTCSFSPDRFENRYGYSRIGMSEKDDKREIKFYERLFPRENVLIHLPGESDAEIAIESVYDPGFTGKGSPHYNRLVDYIYKHHDGKNSMVLCGGYKEAAFISDLYREKYGDVNVIHSDPTVKTSSTIDRFKREGGILFAIRNYNTGISLEGELLERLFIVKLPFVDYTTKRWQELKMLSAGIFRTTMNREMLIVFMQTLGRLQRTKSDRGEIHLLDTRFVQMKSGMKKRVIAIAETYGLLSDKEPKSRKEERRLVDNEDLLALLA